MPPDLDPLLARLIELEQDIHYQAPAEPGQAEFRHEPGVRPVLLSAPHGAAHRRHGQYKDEDEFTAGLARLVAERSGAHVLYLRRRSAEDANVDGGSGYKEALRRIAAESRLRFVLDLHGAHPEHAFGLALGSMKGQSCPPDRLQAILEVLARHGFSQQAADPLYRLDVDQKFPGSGSAQRETVTRFLHRLGVPAVQIEINARLRIAQRKPDASIHKPAYPVEPARIRNVVEALEEVVQVVEQ